MQIEAQITKIGYQIFLASELTKIPLNSFNCNTAPTACLVEDGDKVFAISKWVSPKRTRSYPYERVYNTLNYPKKLTIIPIVKDEGASGDRDFIQWDTVSFMSLLDVYVIFGYYCKATRKGSKITRQQFDNEYIIQKIKEIESFHSSALHWNLKEIKEGFQGILRKVKECYTQIEIDTGIQLHNVKGIDNFRKKIGEEVEEFMAFSRGKALKAQLREWKVIQPKEFLLSASKATITISNYLGGKYYLTVDELQIDLDAAILCEGKHSKNALLPSKSDIKDGLLKMILFSNLSNVKIGENVYKAYPMLALTSNRLKGSVLSNDTLITRETFFEKNRFSTRQKAFLWLLFEEANMNNFIVKISGVE